jgi:hypothetical protein
VRREEEDNSDNKQQGPEREKLQRQGDEEIYYSNYHLKGGDCSYNTSNEYNEDPQPENPRRVSLTPASNALTPPNESLEQMQERGSIDNNSSEDEYYSHYTNNKDGEDKDLRLTKRQKLTLVSAIPKSTVKLSGRLVSPIPVATDDAQDQIKGLSSASSKRHNPL